MNEIDLLWTFNMIFFVVLIWRRIYPWLSEQGGGWMKKNLTIILSFCEIIQLSFLGNDINHVVSSDLMRIGYGIIRQTPIIL